MCRFLLSFLLLRVLANYVVASSNISDVSLMCKSKLTCRECIQEASCGWCLDPTSVFSNSRCSSLPNNECPEEFIYYPENTMVIVTKNSFIRGYDKEDRIMPRKIHLKLREKAAQNILIEYRHESGPDSWDYLSSTVLLRHNATDPVLAQIFIKCPTASDSWVQTNQCNRLKNGDMVQFKVVIAITKCPSDSREWKKTIEVAPSGVNDSLIINLELLCDCPCEGPENYIEHAPQCNYQGTYKCGFCECDSNTFGSHCECRTEVNSTSDAKMKAENNCKSPENDMECSGKGSCLCGRCECEFRIHTEGRVYGDFCECDDSSCARSDGLLCGGPDRGRCVCGKCLCKDGWTGNDCSCSRSETTCYNLDSKDNKICSGHGTCECGACICEEGHPGRYCDKNLNSEQATQGLADRKNNCQNLNTCNECITGQNCAWCTVSLYDGPRCFQSEIYERSCPQQFIFNPENKMTVLVDSVESEIRPQSIQVTLRPNQSVRVPISYTMRYSPFPWGSTVDLKYNLPEHLTARFFSSCRSTVERIIETHVCANIKTGESIQYNLELLLSRCPSDPRDWEKTVEINAIGSTHKLIINVQMMCNCPCDTANMIENSAHCYFHGTYKCGVCECNPGFSGKFCESEVTTVSHQPNPWIDCGTKTSCHECIKISSCGWCMDPEVKSRQRCFQSTPFVEKCRPEFMFNPQNEVEIAITRPSESKQYLVKPQINPEAVNVNIRQGQPLQIPFKFTQTSALPPPYYASVEIKSSSVSNIKVKFLTNCLNRNGALTETNRCANVPRGAIVQFIAELELISCPTDSTYWWDFIDIYLVGDKEEHLTIDLEMLCGCDCEEPGDKNYIENADLCNRHGNYTCALCQCYSGYSGDFCEGRINTTPPSGACLSPANSLECYNSVSRSICSGHGQCDCGTCRCQAPYSGRFCEECLTCIVGPTGSGRCEARTDINDCISTQSCVYCNDPSLGSNGRCIRSDQAQRYSYCIGQKVSDQKQSAIEVFSNQNLSLEREIYFAPQAMQVTLRPNQKARTNFHFLALSPKNWYSSSSVEMAHNASREVQIRFVTRCLNQYGPLVETNSCPAINMNDVLEFFIELELTVCPRNPRDWLQRIDVYPVTHSGHLYIDLIMFCENQSESPCEEGYIENAARCYYHGTYKCGTCACYSGFSGTLCETDDSVTELPAPLVLPNSCTKKSTCQDCIQTSSCAWCDDPNVGSGIRCFESVNYNELKSQCRPEFIYNPINTALIIPSDLKRPQLYAVRKGVTYRKISLELRINQTYTIQLFVSPLATSRVWGAPEAVGISYSSPGMVSVRVFTKCSDSNGMLKETNKCSNTEGNNTVEFKVELNLLKCPQNNEEWKQTIEVFSSSVNEYFVVDLELLCGCQCESSIEDSAQCSYRGTNKCGICYCHSGFTGRSCEQISNTRENRCVAPQTDIECSGRGSCVNGVCICSPGIGGQYCDQRADPLIEANNNKCVSPENDLECSGRGTCADGICVCAPGIGGRFCNRVANDEGCISPYNNLTCSGTGKCFNGACLCNPGVSGQYCDLPVEQSNCISPQNGLECSGRGRCVDGFCVCNPGIAGQYCDQRASYPGLNNTFCIFPQQSVECFGRGRCVNGVCRCPPQFDGQFCERTVNTNRNPCISPENDLECSGRGRCVNGVCVCSSGIAGEFCDQSANLQDKCISPGSLLECSGRGTCLNGICNCVSGIAGKFCDRAADRDDDMQKCISPYNNVECSGRGLCANGICKCISGLSGQFCELTGEGQFKDLKKKNCLSPTNNLECSGAGRCIDGKCSCTIGVTGQFCELLLTTENNLNACVSPENGLECSGRGTCVNGICKCQARYSELETIYGVYCECDNFSCQRHNDLLCSGPIQGDCSCGTCVCRDGWTGNACECSTFNSTCYNHNSRDGRICSGHGQCDCGVCKCEASYSGTFCEDCPTCPVYRPPLERPQELVINSCAKENTCHECIQNPSCGWCFAPEFNSYPRCFSASNPTSSKTQCPQQFLYNPDNQVTISDIGHVEAINQHRNQKQIFPKRISVKLRGNQSQSVDLAYIHEASLNSWLLSNVTLKHNFSSNVRVRFFTSCFREDDASSTETNTCSYVPGGSLIRFKISIELLQCPSERNKWIQPFRIYPDGSYEDFVVDLEMLCACPCENPGSALYYRQSPRCHYHGDISCGICECHSGFSGKSCEESVGTKTEDLRANCISPLNSLECSGRGRCGRDGTCQCDIQRNRNEIIYGTFCECDNFSCPRHNGLLCGGPEHGSCQCGTCSCSDQWSGLDCSCQKSHSNCFDPVSGMICAGQGHCRCGACECRPPYSGQFCEICPTCGRDPDFDVRIH